jgi:hypothetical protein
LSHEALVIGSALPVTGAQSPPVRAAGRPCTPRWTSAWALRSR